HAQGVGDGDDPEEAGDAGKTRTDRHHRRSADDRSRVVGHEPPRGRNLRPHHRSRKSTAPAVTKSATRLYAVDRTISCDCAIRPPCGARIWTVIGNRPVVCAWTAIWTSRDSPGR